MPLSRWNVACAENKEKVGGFKTKNVIHAIVNEGSLAFPALAGVGGR